MNAPNFVVCIAIIFATMFVSQACSQVISIDLTDGRTVAAVNSAVRETWDEDAFAAATPQNMPLAEKTVDEMKASGARGARDPIDDFEIQSRESETAVRADERVIAISRLPPDTSVGARATGTRGAYFSSSRLIPMDARLTYPYSPSGKIFFEKADGSRFICSGSVIDSRLVATAGHCVHRGTGGGSGFYRNIIFIPAWHEGEAPFGVWSATWIATTSTWATSDGVVPNSGDFAVFEVADQTISGQLARLGDIVGTYGFKTDALLENHVKIIGYPGSFDAGNIMHQVDSGDPAAADSNTVLYGSDMRGGSSGGAWIQNFGEKADGQPGAMDGRFNTIVGITSYGFNSEQPMVQGSSVLNNDFVSLYDAGCDRDSENCD